MGTSQFIQQYLQQYRIRVSGNSLSDPGVQKVDTVI
jgi:hypothetical protein